MPIDGAPDHVAIAVPAVDAACARWCDELGGRWIGPRKDLSDPERMFDARQFRFGNGAKLEMLAPMRDDSPIRRFLDRFGARVHHLTFAVAALQPCIDEVEDAGYDVVDVSFDEHWHEGYLRPSQVGGLIVQLVWMGRSEEDNATAQGFVPEPPPAHAAHLLGPTLAHPDLERSEALWRLLGGEVTREGDRLVAAWPQAPISVQVLAGERSEPLGLRVAHGTALPADPALGPATLTA